jgi:hypothetical protein
MTSIAVDMPAVDFSLPYHLFLPSVARFKKMGKRSDDDFSHLSPV